MGSYDSSMSARRRTEPLLWVSALSLAVPLLGPLVWFSCTRAINSATPDEDNTQLVVARRMAIVASIMLFGIFALGMSGQPSSTP